MAEHKKLLGLLYPDGYPDEWNYNKHIQDYLLKLGTYKVENLIKEPERLNHESTVLREQIQELAVSNYKTFIDTAKCSKELFVQFNNIERKVAQLLEDVPKFEDKCIAFGEKSSGINDLRRLNSSTLTKSAQLLEILELPQLMNSFINDGLYEDALELAAYVWKLNGKHSDIPIFKSIAEDINNSYQLMLRQLILQLSQELSLSKCLQIVSHLRRMQVYTEPELRILFLQSRNKWFEQSLRVIPKDDVSRYLSKTIEVTRVNLFNILTQYRAIFNDDEHSPLGTAKNQNVNQNVIFCMWMNDKISEFLATLEEGLKSVSTIESIVDQCMYFALSFSKVGCDFRTLLVPIFTNRILHNFEDAITQATENFKINIEKFTLIDRNHHANIPWRTKSEDPLQPPDSLLEFYPLADFLNTVLNAFNKLKLCAPVALIDDIVDCLQQALTLIAKSLLNLYGLEQQAFTTSSKDAFTRLCMSFSDDLVPYIQKCLHSIYPPSNIAVVLGVTVTALHDNHITFLNKQSIIEPISHLLPVKIQPDILEVVPAEQTENVVGKVLKDDVETQGEDDLEPKVKDDVEPKVEGDVESKVEDDVEPKVEDDVEPKVEDDTIGNAGQEENKDKEESDV